MVRKYLERTGLSGFFIDPESWEEVYTLDLSKEQQEDFMRKKKAINLFLKTEMSVKSILEQTRLNSETLYYFVNRCLTLNEDGGIYGYKALLPYFRIKSYEVNSYNKSYTGNFSKLLTDYPDLEKLLVEEYFNKNKKVVREKKQSYKNIHKKFVNKCSDLGISKDHYPFTSSTFAYKSITRFLNSLANGSQKANLTSKEALMINRNVNNTTNAYTHVVRPFERVEFDAHVIDAIFSIVTYTPSGDKIINNMSRVWLLCVIDVASRGIIGYHISYSNNNYSSKEFLQCLKKSLIPWTPKNLTIPGLQYNHGSGFPSYIITDTRYAIWDEISMDNAKAHKSKKVLDNLMKLNCAINFGPVANPVRRAIIERFFRTLEFSSFHRIPSTTGSNPMDSIRENAEEKSIIYEITIDHMEEIMDVVIANYNSTKHSAHNGFSPLEVIQNRINRGMYIRRLSENQKETSDLFSNSLKVMVRGNINEGRNGYINYMYQRYSSPKLNNDTSVIGKQLTLLIDDDNIQHIKAFLSDGSLYDTLTAKGIWGKVPHSLEMRHQIMKHKNSTEFDYLKYEDPIEAYQNFLATKSISDKKARIKLQEIKRYKKEHNADVMLEDEKKEIQKLYSKNEGIQQKIIKKNSRVLSGRKVKDEVKNIKQIEVSNSMIEKNLNAEIDERHKKTIEKFGKTKGKSITF
ncbi:DDE-type integrase/transposase/recombinase [Planococcus soli]|uniref:DDE-type integrase/transposase/recombinase n=1 Tax=Planococcus soli TaxID=2666072 RepID=UPI00115D50B3|nr:DDE-type integrase/transposase/recombinase [Planococcus soli]